MYVLQDGIAGAQVQSSLQPASSEGYSTLPVHQHFRNRLLRKMMIGASGSHSNTGSINRKQQSFLLITVFSCCALSPRKLGCNSMQQLGNVAVEEGQCRLTAGGVHSWHHLYQCQRSGCTY